MANLEHESILLAHGGGGSLTRLLIEGTFVKTFSNRILNELGDSAVIESPGRQLAFTTDSYVVKPLFFKGGDIGKLAVCGTVNDLAMAGARPLYISLSLIIEEGFLVKRLHAIMDSIKVAASEANVIVVTGDTKVVERGAADELFINTSGIGALSDGISLGAKQVRVGDTILLNGSLAEHGISVLSQRGEYGFEANIASDVAPLAGMVQSILAVAPNIHFMRDLTRGGLAAALNELAVSAGIAIEVDEQSIPIRKEVLAACNMLGLDPLHVANEGKCIVVCAEDCDEKVLEAMRRHEYGKDAVRIGRIIEHKKSIVIGRTPIGGKRIIDMPSGRLLPRIC